LIGIFSEALVRRDGPLKILGATLLAVAAVNYWAYDRFLLSYVLATGCNGCNAPTPNVPSAEELFGVVAAGSAYLLLLTAVHQSSRRAVWGWGTLLIALVTTLLMARSHTHAVVGASARWRAVNEPVQLALYCGASCTLSALLLAIRGPCRRGFVSGAASVVAITGTCLMAYGASNWSRGCVIAPMAKAALLLAGTGDVVTWWKRSLAAVLAAGTLLAIVAVRSEHRRRWSEWPWLAAGAVAVWLTIPHARDALHPLPLRGAVPVGLSRVSTCLAASLPDSVPLERAPQNVPVAPDTVGYLAAPFTTPVSALEPLLNRALETGIHLVVVPARRSRTVSSHTLGTLPYEEVCWGGKVRLSSSAESRPIADFATLGDLIRSDIAIDPGVGPVGN
jgi:hypothetical protein